MKAYRTYATVRKTRELVLPNVPFSEGQRVEVVILADEPSQDHTVELRALLSETQALSAVRHLTDDDIRAEVAAYQAGQ